MRFPLLELAQPPSGVLIPASRDRNCAHLVAYLMIRNSCFDYYNIVALLID